VNDTSDKYANFSHDELVAEINRLKKHKKYGLVWEHKTEKVIEDFETQQPYLEEVTDKRIEDAPGEPTNLIIEGDNFEALSILNYTHAGKVDVIYIDPPYNTGNKDFIYNDNYVDSEDEFRHSKWLSFMEPRLKLAKNLLKDDGVIFISIDDNEHAALMMLCDEIFGRDNRLGNSGNIVWLKKNSDTASDNLAKNHEYVVALQKTPNANTNQVKIVKEKVLKENDSYYIDKGEILGFGMLNINNRPRLGYSFYYHPIHNDLIPLADQDIDKARISNNYDEIYTDNLDLVKKGYIPVRPSKVRGKIKCWGSSLETVKQNIGDYYVIKKKDSYTIHKKIRIDPNTVKCGDGGYYIEKKKEYPLTSVIDWISSKSGIDDLYESLGEKNFNNPKPVELIKYLISHSSKDAIIVDFFAGSGTTAQAVLEENREKKLNRQYIVCTNNENEILNKTTLPRILKLTKKNSSNLRYYKINHREKKPSIDANRQDIVTYMENIIQVKENAYKQLEVNEDFAIYESNEKYVGLVFEPFSIEEVITNLKEQNTEKRPVKLYVFSYSRDAFEDDYGADFEIEFVAMPEGLLKTYAHIVEEQKKEDL